MLYSIVLVAQETEASRVGNSHVCHFIMPTRSVTVLFVVITRTVVYLSGDFEDVDINRRFCYDRRTKKTDRCTCTIRAAFFFVAY